jgi:uncharacterized protein YycO
MSPQPGDFFVTRIEGFTGRAIRVAQFLNGSGFADFEHAGVVVPNDYGLPTRIVEAEPGGAQRNSIRKLDPAHTRYSSLDLTSVQRDKIVSTALSLVGTPYSFLDYAALAARRLHIPVPGLREYIANGKHLICSQLVDYCYRQAGVELFADGRWPGYVTPGDLAGVLEGPR